MGKAEKSFKIVNVNTRHNRKVLCMAVQEEVFFEGGPHNQDGLPLLGRHHFGFRRGQLLHQLHRIRALDLAFVEVAGLNAMGDPGSL